MIPISRTPSRHPHQKTLDPTNLTGGIELSDDALAPVPPYGLRALRKAQAEVRIRRHHDLTGSLK